MWHPVDYWGCCPVQQIQVRGQDIEDPVSGCTDLWVLVDPDGETVSLPVEGIDLLRKVPSVGDAFLRPEPLPLAGDLDESLAIVAGHLDLLCW